MPQTTRPNEYLSLTPTGRSNGLVGGAVARIPGAVAPGTVTLLPLPPHAARVSVLNFAVPVAYVLPPARALPAASTRSDALTSLACAGPAQSARTANAASRARRSG